MSTRIVRYLIPVGETIPPRNVVMTIPGTNGTTISSLAPFHFQGYAEDNVAVTRMEFYVDGTTLMGTVNATTTPQNYFDFNFSTDGMINGPHSFHVQAYDAAGNSTPSGIRSAIVTNSSNPAGRLEWLAIPTDDSQALVNGVAIDGSGNTIVVGQFTSKIDFGPPSGSQTGLSTDAFVAKFNSNGGLIFCRRLGNASVKFARAVAVDASGNIFITGGYQSATVDFGGGNLPYQGGFGSPSDIFILKLNSSGDYRWAKGYGGPAGDVGAAIAVDSAGHPYICGTGFSIDFGGVMLGNIGLIDIVIAKLDKDDGHTLWAKLWGSAGADAANGIAIDSSNNVLVVGKIANGGNLGSTNKPAGVYLAKYSGADGSWIWDNVFAGTGNGNAVAIHPVSGNIFITGDYTAPGGVGMDFGGGARTTTGMFIAGYTSGGAYIIDESPLSTGTGGKGVAMDSSTNLIISGFQSAAPITMDFTVSITAITTRWSQGSGGSSSSQAAGIARITDFVSVGGSFKGSVDFGGTSHTASTISFNAFVARYHI